MPSDQSNMTLLFVKPSALDPKKFRAVYIHRDKFSSILSELLSKADWECRGAFTTLHGALQDALPEGMTIHTREYHGPAQPGSEIPGIWRTF